MEQKDYKAIGKIIKAHKFDLAMVKELADYFEKEQDLGNGLIKCCVCGRKTPKSNPCCTKKQFNRKEFIKDCGVK